MKKCVPRQSPSPVILIRLSEDLSSPDVVCAVVPAAPDLLSSNCIVATTCLGVSAHFLTNRRFDYCIVDEASQVTMPLCLGPLRLCDCFILVGDHKQLPPLVASDGAKKLGLEESLFERLSEAHPHAAVCLRFQVFLLPTSDSLPYRSRELLSPLGDSSQYRMNREIMSLANHLAYDGALVCGNEDIAQVSSV